MRITSHIQQELLQAYVEASHIAANATNDNYRHYAHRIKMAIGNGKQHIESLQTRSGNQYENIAFCIETLRKAQRQIATLTGDNKVLKARVADITEKRNYFRNRTTELRRDLHVTNKQVDQYLTSNRILRERVKELEAQVSNLTTMPYQRLAERAELAEKQVAALREDNNRLHQANQGLQERNETQAALVSRHALAEGKMTQEVDGLTKENLKLCERNSILALEKQSLTRRVENQRETIRILDGATKESEQLKELTANQATTLRNFRQHNANLEFQIATLKKAAELKHVDEAGLKMELNEWEKGFNKVRKERDEWRILCEKTQQERNVLAEGLDEAVEKLKTAEYVKELSRKAAVAWFENWRKQAEELKDTKEKLENEVGIRGNTIRKLQADNLRAHTLFSRAIQYVPQMSLPGIYRGL